MRRLDNELQCLNWRIAVQIPKTARNGLHESLRHYIQLDVIIYQSLQLGEIMSFGVVKGLGHSSSNDNSLLISAQCT